MSIPATGPTLDEFLTETLGPTVLWRQKSPTEYVCISETPEPLERGFDAGMARDDIRRLILVKDICKPAPTKTYFDLLTETLKRYKINPEILDQTEADQIFNAEPTHKSKLWIRTRSGAVPPGPSVPDTGPASN